MSLSGFDLAFLYVEGIFPSIVVSAYDCACILVLGEIMLSASENEIVKHMSSYLIRLSGKETSATVTLFIFYFIFHTFNTVSSPDRPQLCVMI